MYFNKFISACKILTGRSTGKRPVGRPRHRWKDNIRLDIKVIDLKDTQEKILNE